MSCAKVYVRVRPSNEENNMICINNKEIGIHINRDGNYIVNNQINDWSFTFNNIFHNISQDKLYEQTTESIIDKALIGFNGIVMCYGQTGSGKTYTMFGATEMYENRGIVPRALNSLFRKISNKPRSNIIIRVSYFEIYNDRIYDLIKTDKNVDYQVVDDEIGTYIKGLSYLQVKNEEDALYLLFEGELNRTRRPHSLNKNSSRSHCIYTIYIEAHDPDKENANYSLSKINFVDLAGSERIGKSEVSGNSKTEAIYINKSLSFLEQTVVAMVNKSRDHVPYRQSTLTHYLQDSLNGTSNVVLISNIWEDERHIQETVSTLRFSSRMMKIQVKPVKSDLIDANSKVKKLLEEIKFLKNELYMHDSFINKPITCHEEISEQQKFEIAEKAEKFLKGELPEIEVQNFRQVQTYFQTFQRIWNKHNNENSFKASESVENVSNDYPSKKNRLSRGTAKISNGKTEDVKKEPIPSSSEGFEEYKIGEGKDLYSTLMENKEITKKLKMEYSEIARKLNSIKSQIDDLKSQISSKTAERRKMEGIFHGSDGEEVITEEEYNLIKLMKKKRDNYYELYENIRNIKQKVAYANTAVIKCRESLLKEFELWYEEQFNLKPEMTTEFDIQMPETFANEDDENKFNETRKMVANRRMYSHKCLEPITNI